MRKIPINFVRPLGSDAVLKFYTRVIYPGLNNAYTSAINIFYENKY